MNHLHEGIALGMGGEVEKQSAILGRNAVWKTTKRVSRLPKFLSVQVRGG